MILTEAQRKSIEAIVNIFETGKANGDYSSTEVLPDFAGITYGRACTTLNSGNLYKLVKMYLETPRNDGYNTFKDQIDVLEKALDRFKTKDQTLNTDDNVLEALRVVGNSNIMKLVQDRFFDITYFQPAFRKCEELGLLYPLSCAVVYDSFVQGSFAHVRKLFPETPPCNGGDEKRWVKAYVDARYAWLSSRKTPIIRKTVYRMTEFRLLIAANNWMLSSPLKVRGVVIS